MLRNRQISVDSDGLLCADPSLSSAQTPRNSSSPREFSAGRSSLKRFCISFPLTHLPFPPFTRALPALLSSPPASPFLDQARASRGVDKRMVFPFAGWQDGASMECWWLTIFPIPPTWDPLVAAGPLPPARG
eukprot:3402941-Rhodomonas_salina.2